MIKLQQKLKKSSWQETVFQFFNQFFLKYLQNACVAILLQFMLVFGVAQEFVINVYVFIYVKKCTRDVGATKHVFCSTSQYWSIYRSNYY